MGRTRSNYHHGEGRYHIAISQIQALSGAVFGSLLLGTMAFGHYFFSDSFGYRTIFDERAFSNYFQCRDSHVVTWMHMTSRLNTTRGSQWWQNNGVGVRLVTGARRPFKSKGQGAFQYSSLRFEVNYPSFWCCLRFLWACYQFHTGSGAIVLTATGIQHCGLAKVRGSRSYVWSRWDVRDNVRWKVPWVQLISTMAFDSHFQTR